MGFEEKVLKSKELGAMLEFLTIQSSEQTEEEVRYKDINRKQIRFDLGDLATMLKLGKLIKPYGLKQYLVNVLSGSRFSFLRILAEKKLAKRGASFLRSLYLKHPEKFASVDLSSNKKTMRTSKIRCSNLMSLRSASGPKKRLRIELRISSAFSILSIQKNLEK